MKRVLAGVLAAFYTLSSIHMLMNGKGWFATIPGVNDTGPYNPHLVVDVGLAFLAAGGGLAAFAWRPKLWAAALAGSVFPAFHAGFHLVGMARGNTEHAAFELLLVVLPAALAVAVAWPKRVQRQELRHA